MNYLFSRRTIYHSLDAKIVAFSIFLFFLLLILFPYTTDASLVVNSSQNPGSLSQGLVGWWTMDGKNLINNVTDSSGLGNNGYMQGFGATSSAIVAGKLGQGLKFDGVDDYVTRSSLSVISKNNSFSVSLWFKWSSKSLTDHPTILQNTISSSDLFTIQMTSTAALTMGVYNGTAYSKVSTPFTDTKSWHHLVAVYDGATITGYLDDVLMSGSVNPSTGVVTGSLNIGHADSGRYFKGFLDDVRIYSRALSASEIKQLYNMGR